MSAFQAARDSTATAPTDGKLHTLRMGAGGGLLVETIFTSCAVGSEHDTTEIAANRGFIVTGNGDLVFRLRDDTQDRTITGIVAPAYFLGLDIKLFKAASTATILILR